jgi:hypothetical protein
MVPVNDSYGIMGSGPNMFQCIDLLNLKGKLKIMGTDPNITLSGYAFACRVHQTVNFKRKGK